MKKESPASSFTVSHRAELGNIYELVVVAALRARQLNRFPHLRDRDAGRTLVDQALGEAVTLKLPYAISDREEPLMGAPLNVEA
ncbi:MAG: DNA-directed RNA polymerase subunit omega [Candidatus Eisenbacteria bacterium]